MQKSFVQISDGGEEIEWQPQAFSVVAVSAAQNTKVFEVAQGMFNGNVACGQSVMMLFLLGCERMVPAFVVWRLAVGMKFVHALISPDNRYRPVVPGEAQRLNEYS